MIVEMFWASFGAVLAFVLGGLVSLVPEDINDVFEDEEQ